MVAALTKVGVAGYGCGKDNKASHSEGETKGVERQNQRLTLICVGA
jgi:hypothetical protein